VARPARLVSASGAPTTIAAATIGTTTVAAPVGAAKTTAPEGAAAAGRGGVAGVAVGVAAVGEGSIAAYDGPLAGPFKVLQADQAGYSKAIAAASAVGQVTVAVSDAKMMIHPEQQREIRWATTLVPTGVAERGQQQRGAVGIGRLSAHRRPRLVGQMAPERGVAKGCVVSIMQGQFLP